MGTKMKSPDKIYWNNNIHNPIFTRFCKCGRSKQFGYLADAQSYYDCNDCQKKWRISIVGRKQND